MNTDLIEKMLEWKKLQLAANELKTEIEAEVFEIGKTQTVGDIRVTYSKPSRSFLYEDAVKDSGLDYDTSEYETVKVNWRKMAKDLNLEVDYAQKSPAKATLKLL